jgi:SNF2 family DNA or RNA helicase
MARRSALLQICSDPGAVVEGYNETPAKYLAIDRLLSELIEGGGEKVVLWAFYRYTLQRLDERYRRYGLVRVDGSVTSPLDRAAAIRSFQEDPGVRVFLGIPAAAGAGITLTAAAHAIYESFSNQPAHYLQSVDRIHRRGQQRQVVSHVLIASGSIDEVEFERLVTKEASGRELLQDPRREQVTRARFIRGLGVESPLAD